MPFISEEDLTAIINTDQYESAEYHAIELGVPLGELLRTLEADARFLVEPQDGKKRKDSLIVPIVDPEPEEGEDNEDSNSSDTLDVFGRGAAEDAQDSESDPDDVGDKGGQKDSELELPDLPYVAGTEQDEDTYDEEDL